MSKDFERAVLKELKKLNTTLDHYIISINNLKESRKRHHEQLKELFDRIDVLERAKKTAGSSLSPRI